jgi:predicted enzyme related to lactoylglutathione lyase
MEGLLPGINAIINKEMGSLKGYDNFLLPVADMDKAKAFYHDVLGFDVKFDSSDMGMVAYRVGQEEPALILTDLAKFPAAKPAIWFVVGDVKEEYEKLCKKGIQFLSAPFEIKTGLAAEFEDPFGNRFAITDYTKVL